MTGVSAGTATLTASASLPANTSVCAYNPSCSNANEGFQNTGAATVASCPATLLLGQTYTPTLASNDPPYKTGMGLLVTMMASAGHDGAQIAETITNGANNGCPFTLTCSGGLPFTVGPPNAVKIYGVTLPNIDNAFYDQHVALNGSDLLGGTGVTSCNVTCNQVYSCNGAAIGKFTILYKFSHGTLSGQGVTNVSATKTASN